MQQKRPRLPPDAERCVKPLVASFLLTAGKIDRASPSSPSLTHSLTSLFSCTQPHTTTTITTTMAVSLRLLPVKWFCGARRAAFGASRQAVWDESRLRLLFFPSSRRSSSREPLMRSTAVFFSKHQKEKSHFNFCLFFFFFFSLRHSHFYS